MFFVVSLIHLTLMMGAVHSSETSVLIRAIRRHIQEDGILNSRRLENLKSYVLTYLPIIAYFLLSLSGGLYWRW
jgi:hypothetical protein